MRCAVGMMIVLVCASGMARAGEATTRPVDLSSPRAALRSFVEALRAGDGEGAKRACHVTQEKDQKVFDASIGFEAALEKLVAAVEEKFGQGAAVPLREKLAEVGPADVVPAMEKAIEGAPETSSEDRLTVQCPEAGDFNMIRVDADWKIDVSEMLNEMDGRQRQQMVRQMPRATKNLDAATEALASGKIASVDDLMAVVKVAGSK